MVPTTNALSYQSPFKVTQKLKRVNNFSWFRNSREKMLYVFLNCREYYLYSMEKVNAIMNIFFV